MKTSKIVFFLLITGLIFPETSCKKSDSYDSSKAVTGDFIGTWTGKVSTFKNNHTIVLAGDIVFYYEPDGTTVSGLMSLDKVYLIIPFQLANGTYYFSVVNSDTLDPELPELEPPGEHQAVRTRFRRRIPGREGMRTFRGRVGKLYRENGPYEP